MKRLILAAILCLAVTPLLAGCGRKIQADTASEAPPPAQVEREQDSSGFSVDHPEQFPLATAGEHKAALEVTVTGVVSAHVSRTVPSLGPCRRDQGPVGGGRDSFS